MENKETNNEVTQLVSNLFPSFGPINLESVSYTHLTLPTTLVV